MFYLCSWCLWSLSVIIIIPVFIYFSLEYIVNEVSTSMYFEVKMRGEWTKICSYSNYSVWLHFAVSPCCTLACPLWKKWKASEALGFTCFTTGKIFRMSSSVKAGLWRLSKLYSFIRIWKAKVKSRKKGHEGCLVKCHRGSLWTKWVVTWMPVLMEISLSRVVFWRPYFSTTWSTLSLWKTTYQLSPRNGVK